MDLSNEQAQQLFDAGGFIIITDLPEGSEFGIDGTYHITRRLSGLKFVPPGLHLISISSPASTSRTSGIPIRTAYLRTLRPRERLVLEYQQDTENIQIQENALISDDHLRNLDKELAPYPFDGLNQWKRLTRRIDQSLLDSVVGTNGRVDGIMSVEGEDEGESTRIADMSDEARQGTLRFPNFRLKRSWRDGAVGEEVTRYAKDKSWLLGNVVQTQLNNDPFKLLGNLQLAFILLLHLSSYSALLVYKRFLSLFTRSSSFLITPQDYSPGLRDAQPLFVGFITALAAQLRALPDGVFETELPDLDLYYMDEIEAVRQNFSAVSLGEKGRDEISAAWADLRSATQRWKWDIGDIEADKVVSEEHSESEEGEYAPVVVET